MKDNKNQNQVRLVVVPFLLLIVLVLGSSILLVLFYDRFFSGFLQGKNNTFCQDYFENFIKDKQEEDIDKTLLSYQICNGPLKKKHFIWIQMDGFSYDQLKYVKEEVSKDILIYKVIGPDYRQTGAIHEAYLTGKPSLNFIGGKIVGDNIAIQIAQAKELQQQSKVYLIGSEYPLFDLISSDVDKSKVGSEYGVFKLLCGMKDGEDTSKMFDWENEIKEYDFNKAGVHFDKDELESILRRKFQTYLNGSEFDEGFRDCLSSSPLLNEDSSPNALNHAYSKSHSYNFYSYFRINKMIISIIKYIQTNLKDTVLFLSSDHGGQFFNGEDNFCNHGCVSDDNQGILLVASNNTISNGNSAEINYLDLMPTVSQYLEGVNLPLFNKGKSHPFQKDDFQSEVLAEHMKFIQLKECLFKVEGQEIPEIDNLEQKYNDIFKRKLTKEQQIQILEEYSETNQRLQQKVQDFERSQKDYKLINFLKVLCLVGLCYIVVCNFKKALNEWKQLQTMQKVLITMIIIMYYSENIIALRVQSIGTRFYETSFYINIIMLICFFIFFSIYDFSKCSIKKIKLSFHKSDSNRYEDIEEQSMNTAYNYEQAQVDSSDSLEISNSESKSSSKISKLKLIISKFTKLPSFYSNNLDSVLTLRGCLLIIIAFNILFLIMIRVDAFVYTKKLFMETVKKWDALNVFNYTIFILFYYSPKIKAIQINKTQICYYIFLFIMMIGYDLIDLRYLVRKTNGQIFMCRFITVYYFCGLLYNIKKGATLLKQDDKQYKSSSLNLHQYSNVRDTSSSTLDIRKTFFVFLHIDSSIFVFWIADEVERLYLILLYFTLSVFVRKVKRILELASAQNTKGLLNSFIIDFFIVVLLFKNAQIIYSAFKGTLQMDINIQAGNKTIGEYQDQTPLYTAILFGVDKVLVMIFVYMDILQSMFRIYIKQNVIKFDNASKELLAVILLKILITGFQTCYNFFDESSFLSMFFWFAGMSVIILLSLLPYSIIKFVLFCKGFIEKINFKKQQYHLSV